MWTKPAVAVAACLWLLAAAANFRPSSAAQDATHEDIRTAIYSFAHTLRDNVDKLERHERREKQSGDQMQNLLLAVVNKQREQAAFNGEMEQDVKNLAQSVVALSNAERDEAAGRADMKSTLDAMSNAVAAGDTGLTAMLKDEKASADKFRSALAAKLDAISGRMDTLQSRFDALEQAPKPLASNDAVLEAIQKMTDRMGEAGSAAGPGANGTSQLVQETGHAVLEAVRALSDRLDAGDRRREEADARLTEASEAAKAFQTDVQNSFRLMSGEVKALSDVERLLVQTADGVMDTKRRIEYSSHQIVAELTAAVGDRARELNASLDAAVERAAKSVLDAQSVVMANLSLKIETEISQVWRQIGIMYQTLTDSASTLSSLQRQTDAYVNGTAVSLNGMDSKVSGIAGRMSEVDENLNYLLGRLSLVTQEFKEIKIGLGEALESVRIGLQTVQGNGTVAAAAAAAVDSGPGPNPIDDEPLSENINQNVLSKTVYTVT